MKRSEAGNAILPNTFQHPNIFIDRLMYYLTAEENTVLTFAVRRILGFQENISSRKDNISLSQFIDGIKSTKDDRPLSKGCGLKTTAVRNALANLEQFKILIPTTEKPDPRKGQEYWLQSNEHAIDWDGLETRKAQTADKARRQTKKARYSVEQKGAVEQKSRESVEQKARVLTDRNTKPTETQGNPHTGADAPILPLEWQIGSGQEQIVIPDEKQAQRRDVANLIATGMGVHSTEAYRIALAFMEARDITIPESKIKGQRKAVREMLEMNVAAEHVKRATRDLIERRMTVTDLFSVSKTAIDLANAAPPSDSSAPKRHLL